jgi:hypothetical protein
LAGRSPTAEKTLSHCWNRDYIHRKTVTSSRISTDADLFKGHRSHIELPYHGAERPEIKKTINRPGFSFENMRYSLLTQDGARGLIRATWEDLRRDACC